MNKPPRRQGREENLIGPTVSLRDLEVIGGFGLLAALS
jgi:hypothetical protein